MNHVTDIVQIKHEVLKATAAYAFAGTLYDEGKDKIPYDLIQGIKPQFRCCVYREREISASGCGWLWASCRWTCCIPTRTAPRWSM